MPNLISCLICGCQVSKYFETYADNTTEISRHSLVCHHHSIEELSELNLSVVWFGSHSKQRLQISDSIKGKIIRKAWISPGCFTVAFLLSDDGLLLIYATDRFIPDIAYFSKSIRRLDEPVGMTLIVNEGGNWLGEGLKASCLGLRFLAEAVERSYPLQRLFFNDKSSITELQFLHHGSLGLSLEIDALTEEGDPLNPSLRLSLLNEPRD